MFEAFKNFFKGRTGGEGPVQARGWDQLPECCGKCHERVIADSIGGRLCNYCRSMHVAESVWGKPIPENEVYEKRQDWCPLQGSVVFTCH